MDITESGFQTPASKKRKALRSPSLPPASQPTKPPSNYKNKISLIATGMPLNTKMELHDILTSKLAEIKAISPVIL